MVDEFAELANEYDDLLLKQDKSPEDWERICAIESTVMSRFGFYLPENCAATEMTGE